MSRKIPIKDWNLKIDYVEPYVNSQNAGFIISWVSDYGFGMYTIYKPHTEEKWYADSECLDHQDDKDFITELMRLFIEQLVIEE